MRRAALSWLGHPVSIVALAVMIANDHWLKRAYGTWWTGKLSDVAGLVFFPALLAAVATLVVPARWSVRWGADRLVLGAAAITAAGFTWVKGTAGGAATASAVLSALAGPSEVLRDATDLFALPALGLAAWVGLREATPHGESTAEPWRRDARASAARKALGVALLPVAVLASVATGPETLGPRVRVVEDGAGGWALNAENCVEGPCDGGDYRWSGSGWTLVRAGDGSSGQLQREDCTPDGSVCFRVHPGELGVEQSTDGGATWTDAWTASSDDAAAMRDWHSHDYLPDEEPRISSDGVGVAETASGFVVVVANGHDGVLLREEDGSWTRPGFDGLGCCEGWTVAPLPTRWMPYGSAEPPAVMWAAIAFVGAATLVALRLRGPRDRSAAGAWLRPTARITGLGAVGLLLIAALANSLPGPQRHVEFTLQDVALGVGELGGGVASLMAFAFAVRARWSDVGIALAAGLGAGALTAVGVFALPGRAWSDVLVGLVVAAGSVWAADRWAARRPFVAVAPRKPRGTAREGEAATPGER